MTRTIAILLYACLLAAGSAAWAADVVPPEIQLPGTQPNEVGNFESPDKCDNCHSGYNNLDPGAEPATGWRGAAMGNAGRDPVFWATLAVAEQDFDGAGDLCIRCHSAGGWYGGRSTPTDGSGLAASDDNGIDCDTCHASTNTDSTGVNPSTGGLLAGVMNSPFIANCTPDPTVPGKCSKVGNINDGEGFYGSGMLSLWPQVNEKLGPFSDAAARHQWQQSAWHRDRDFCGTCHDVSNSAVGDLAGNHGTQSLSPHSGIVSSHDYPCDAPGAVPLPNGGCLNGDREDKAAFNNPPYAYGIVERTFSEYKSSPLHNTLVSDFNSLPAELKVAGGSLEVTYQAALAAGTGGDYADGTDRYFSCQSCHMRPVGGNGYPGCNKAGAPVRKDLPRHDHTGGNYWFAAMTRYQDTAGTLRLGGGLTSTQLLAMDLGAERATRHLREAASLTVSGNDVTVTNLTGHKLITGYPEGRRMWLRIEWRDASDSIIRVDGDYGSLTVDLDGDGQVDDTVETILDLDGSNTRIYEAHYSITREWAAIMQALHGADFALSYDRVTGLPDCTVGQFLADATPDCSGPYHETFHFALNNYVAKDNRIPPYRMSYNEAKTRNALPVPDTQYGNPGANGVFNHWDTLTLNPPANAHHAHIQLLYQGTSWEYMQFLQQANNGTNAFLGGQGSAMLAAWVNAEVKKSTGDPITGVLQVGGDYRMVPPVIMASVNWQVPGSNSHPLASDDSYSVEAGAALNVATPGVLGNDSDPDGDPITAVQDSSAGKGSATLNANGSFTYTYAGSGPYPDTDSFTYHAVDSKGAESNVATVTISVTAPMACGDYTIKATCTADPDCTWTGSPKSGSCIDNVVCVPTQTTEQTCSGGIDEDCDGAVDCADSDCTGTPACPTVNCAQYTDRNSCNAQPTCSWDGRTKTCQ